MFIEAGSGFADAATSATVTRPVAAQDGDRIVVQVVHAASSGAVATPAGFTDLFPFSSISDYGAAVSYRDIQAGDTGWTWTFASGEVAWVWVLLRDVDTVEDSASTIVNAFTGDTTVVPGKASTLVSFASSDVSNVNMTWTATRGGEQIDEVVGAEFLSQAAWVETGVDTSATTTFTHDYASSQDILLFTVAFGAVTAVQNLRVGDVVPTALKAGSTDLSPVYAGDTLVWEQP